MRQIKFDAARFQLDEQGGWLSLRVPSEYRQPARAFVREMPEGKLHIAELKRHRERRSLDANAYCWVLLEKLASAVGSDKDALYRDMVERYGVFMHVIVPPKAVDILRRDYRVVRELGPVVVNGKAGMQCQCYEGSSKYDTAEMARFIDGIVQECEELGIETESPDELARMKREWGS